MGIKNQYHKNGFALVREIIDTKLIDKYINSYKEQLLSDENLSLKRMDTQEYGGIKKKNGYLQHPIADIHLISLVEPSLEETADLALQILTSDSIQDCLKDIYSSNKFSLVMSMFFDQNRGTPAHQDSYYLDSFPHGNLTGIWIALEDIDERSGRFYVIPKTQNQFFELSDDEMKYADKYENLVNNFIKEQNLKVYAPALKKGDAILWNSGTIHGSLKTIDENFSRKSFTAHFLPNSHKYVQNRYSNKFRSTKGFFYNNIECKITNTVKKKGSNNNLIARSIDTFGSQDFSK